MHNDAPACWRIKKWDTTFENHKSRERGAIKWVQFPVHQDSETFLWLLGEPGGVEAIGLFVILVQLAARCPRRGVLADDKGPYTERRLAARYHQSLKRVERSVSLLVEGGWLIVGPVQQESVVPSTASAETPAARPPTAHEPPADRPPRVPTGPDRTGNGIPETTGPGGAPSMLPVRPPPGPALSPRDTLKRCGVDGKALDVLAAVPTITTESIIADVREIESAGNARSVKRVLVARLCERHGIDLGRKDDDLGTEAQRLLDKVREHKRQSAVREHLTGRAAG